LNKIDFFTILPPSYQLGEAFLRLPQEPLQRLHGIQQIAKRVIEHSNEVKRLLGDDPDLAILSTIQ